MLGLRDAADRDHDARRHPRRHRARLVRQLHDGAAEGAATRTGGGCCIPSELAELACDIEIDRLGEPIGKQDQYIAAYGGITCFTFNPRRHASRPSRCSISMDTLFNLEDNLLLFFTGFSRSAGSILKDQNDAHASRATPRCSTNLHYVKELGLRSQRGARRAATPRCSAS